MPFESDAQRRYLWSQKPDVAKKFAEHKSNGGGVGPMMDGRSPKKIIQKDRYGNQLTFEFEPEEKAVDPTRLMEKMMETTHQVPEMMAPPTMDHPGEPRGSDTVPAWLTPGEFVVNAEATQMFGPQIEQMNEQGRAVQEMKHGGAVQMHRMPGGIPMDGPPHLEHGGAIPQRPMPDHSTLYESKFGYGLRKGEYRQDMAEYIQSLLEHAAGPKAQYQADGGLVPVPFDEYLLKKREGYRPDVYEDSRGFPTVGTGHRLSDEYLNQIGTQPYTEDQLTGMFYEDKDSAEAAAKRNAKKYGVDWDSLNRGEKGALTSMAFQLGETGQGNFERMWKAIASGDKSQAAVEALDSDWAYQTPKRAKDVFNALEGFSFNDGGMVPGYYQGGGLTDFWNNYIAGPKTRIGGEPALDYGWNVEEGRPYTQEEGMAAGTTPPQVYDEMDPAGDEYLMLQQQEGPTAKPEIPAPTFGGEDITAAGQRPPPSPPFPPAMIDQGRADEQFYENIPDVPAEEPQTPEPQGNWFQRNILGPELQPEDPAVGFIGPDTAIDDVADPYGAAEASGQSQYHLDRYGPTQATADEFYPGSKELADTDQSGTTTEEEKGAFLEEFLGQADANPEATGPGDDQPGPNVSDTEVEEAGKTADPAMVEKATGFISEAFDDLFDGKELARMALMYTGSRMLGNSHLGSLQWAAKNYVNRIDAKATNKAATTKELLKSGKYTPASIKEYEKTGDISSLVSPTAVPEQTGEYKDFYSSSGKITAQKVKIGDQTKWVDSKGNFVDGTKFNADPSTVRGTKDYNARVNSEATSNVAIIEDLQKTFDAKPKKNEFDKQEYTTEITPSLQGKKIAEWAADNDVDAAQIGTLIEQAYHDAINDAKQTGRKPRDLTPYLNSLIIREQTGLPDLFKTGEDTFVDGAKMASLNRSVLFLAGSNDNLKDKRNIDKLNTFYTMAASNWNKLDADTQKQYNRKAGKGTTGFYTYIHEQLAKQAAL